jgi:P-type Cu2+ transporter
VSAVPTDCYHCGEALAGRAPLWARISDRDVVVCCAGCRAAAQLIGELGLEDFYRFRTAPPEKPVLPAEDWLAYDDPALIETLTRADPRGRAVMLMVDGLTCAACSWLITRSLEQIPGVAHISLNSATGRACIVWDEGQTKLSRLMGVIASLGYQPQIVTGKNADALVQSERRRLLKRLAVAGLGMMQVMMFAVAMYAGNAHGMEADVRAYLRIVSLLVATPVMLYGGWPFFSGAARALAKRSITMEVPVSLALTLAYGASVFNTWRHAGEVYFDSVTMFIFFLTVARYVEMVARHQSTQVSDSLSLMLPVTAHRVSDGSAGDVVRDVAVSQLCAGDCVLVRAGEAVPADGRLERGSTQFDESMLTGESLPVTRTTGDRATAGTINLGSPVQIRLTATGGGTVLASIVALLHRAEAERPRIIRAGDRMASRFLVCVLTGAVLVAAFWCLVDPGRAFAATLAVLVVACPCAFSLATLVAVASAHTALARRGVLATNPDAVESLAKVTRVVFDKTGTLTNGAVSLSRCTAQGALSARECLEIAAALELQSEHPIARAFSEVPHEGQRVENVRVVAGCGIAGTVNGKSYRIGTRAFVSDRRESDAATCETDVDDAVIVLRGEEGDLALFAVEDAPRPESLQAVEGLRRQGLDTEILSGDSLAAVSRLARHCAIATFAARQSPADKLERVNALTREGDFIAMVGDGINDAPVLGGAAVSIAMSRGSALTLASADLILVGDSLRALPGIFVLARRATRIIRQNLLWAAGYNLISMPLAAMGWVPPWAAAIGMSSSSILVVLNSLRLLRKGHPLGRPARSKGTAPLMAAPALPGSAP